MPLDFLPPFYDARLGCFLPVSVLLQNKKELPNAQFLEKGLKFGCLLRRQNLSKVRQQTHLIILIFLILTLKQIDSFSTSIKIISGIFWLCFPTFDSLNHKQKNLEYIIKFCDQLLLLQLQLQFQLKEQQDPMQTIVDWYLVVTPLLGLVVVLTLVAMKLALKAQIDIPSSELKKMRQQEAQQTQKQQPSMLKKSQTLTLLTFLLRNHTFLQPCLTRHSKNKLPMLLSFSAISLLCFFNPSIILNCVIGFPIALVFVAVQIGIQPEMPSTTVMDGQVEDFTYLRQQVKQEDSASSKIKYMYIIYGVFGSGIALGMSGLMFKNYSNLFLSQYLRNFVISCCADIFAVRFVGFALISFPLSFSTKALGLVQIEKLKGMYADFVKAEKERLKNCATNLSPRKKQSNSPTKIPKAVPRLNRQDSENEALKNAMQIAKKIKKQRLPQSDLLRTLTRLNEVQNNQGLSQQYSLNQLFQQQQSRQKEARERERGRQTPIAMYEDDDTNGCKTRRKDTDLVIVQFKRNQQKQEDDSRNEQVIKRRATSFLHSNLDFQDDFTKKDESSQAGTQHNRLNIVKLLNDCNDSVDQNQRRQRIRRHQNSLTLTLDRNDPLKIYENDGAIQEAQFQQIDVNSPERRRRRDGAQDENSEYKLRKKGKHFGGNAKRRVIKFTSGEPYLEYLPNMLSKDPNSKHKKSQPINCKPEFDIIDDRRKSVKKSKTKKEPRFAFGGGDQNQFPGALEVEDI